MNCPECGREVREGAQFCNHCGARLNAEWRPEQQERAEPRWKRRVYELRWIIVAYLVVSCVCMSCACLLGYRTQWILWRLGLR
jgi:uncharacterized membrane protein YvbJ